MANKNINKSIVSKEARKLLKQGIPKQNVFESLVEKHNHSKTIADILKHIPSSEAIKKYGKWNFVLLVNLIVTAILFIISTPAVGIIVWYGLSILCVALKRIRFYVWIAGISIVGIIGFIAILLLSSNTSINWTHTILLVSLYIPSCILPFWLENKLCPKPIEKKEKFVNSQGQQRLRIIYQFIY